MDILNKIKQNILDINESKKAKEMIRERITDSESKGLSDCAKAYSNSDMNNDAETSDGNNSAVGGGGVW